MASFRCYFLDKEYCIKSTENFRCATEVGAIHQAQDALVYQGKYFGFELWEGTRLVHVEWHRKVATHRPEAI